MSLPLALTAHGANMEASEMKKAPEYYDRAKQPRCNICGRFAWWDENKHEWCLSCVQEFSDGTWEHD